MLEECLKKIVRGLDDEVKQALIKQSKDLQAKGVDKAKADMMVIDSNLKELDNDLKSIHKQLGIVTPEPVVSKSTFDHSMKDWEKNQEVLDGSIKDIESTQQFKDLDSKGMLEEYKKIDQDIAAFEGKEAGLIEFFDCALKEAAK